MGVPKKRRAAGLRRQPSALVAPRHQDRLERIRALKAEPPCWGDRRMWASRRFVEQPPGPKKRSVRWLREPHLLVQPNMPWKAKRPPTGRKPRPTKPNEWWGIEMTKVFVEGFGWVSIVVVLDGSTNMIVGDDAGTQCTAQPWLAALDMAVTRQFPAGARRQGLSLMSDHGGQPTSTAFLQACGTWGIQQACTSDHNPKGPADTERGLRTRKEACLWLQEWTSPVELMTALESGLAA